MKFVEWVKEAGVYQIPALIICGIVGGFLGGPVGATVGLVFAFLGLVMCDGLYFYG